MSTLLGNKPCVDPARLYRECAEHNLPTDWWGKANHFRLPLGRGPGRGHVLLRYADLAALVAAGTDPDLVFSGTDAAHRVTVKAVTVLGAKCLTPGGEGDPNAVFLAELADVRHHLERRPVDAAYNVSSPDGSGHLVQTLNSGVEWTWQEVVDDLATACGRTTTEFALPFSPHDKPRNLAYYGGSAWAALCDVLTRVGCAARLNAATGVFDAVRLGTADATADAVATALSGERTWDGYAVDPVRSQIPAAARVYFLKHPRPTDGASPWATVDVALGVAGSVAGTVVSLRDDLAYTAENAALAAARAAERAADWLRKRQGFSRPLSRVYRDFDPAVPGGVLGSTVGAVGLDDRAAMGVSVTSEPDDDLEDWTPLSVLPPWYPHELAVPVALASGYDPVTGYGWGRLDLDTSVPGFVVPTFPLTGDNLFEVNGNEDVPAGTRVLMWPDADGDGWQFEYLKIDCGLAYESDGTVYVDAAFLAGTGLTTESAGGGCLRLAVNAGYLPGDVTLFGCGLVFDGVSTLSVDLTAAVVPPLTWSGCSLDLSIGCGLDVIGGSLVVDNVDLAGNNALTALVVGPGTCDLSVDLDPFTTQTWQRDVVTGFSRAAGGKLRLCVDRYEDTDFFNEAGLLIDHVVGTAQEVCWEVDVCDPDCCDDCTITFAVSVDDSSISLGTVTTLTIDTLSGCTGPYSLTLSWGDGTIEQFDGVSATDTFTHTYATAGTYHVTADAYDACGYAGAAADVTVTVSGSGTVSGCCPDPIPNTLTVTWASATFTYAADLGRTETLTYSAGDGGWVWTGTSNNGNAIRILVYCVGTDWWISWDDFDRGCDVDFQADSQSCGPPLDLEFILADTCWFGSFTLDVTP